MGVSNVCAERKMLPLSVQIDQTQTDSTQYTKLHNGFSTETLFEPKKILFKTIFGILKLKWIVANKDNLTKEYPQHPKKVGIRKFSWFGPFETFHNLSYL